MGSLAAGCGGNPSVFKGYTKYDGSAGVGTGEQPNAGPVIDLNLGGNDGTGEGGAGTVGKGSFCGDSVLDDGEVCDDGNNDPGDGCDAKCQVEDGFSCDQLGGGCYGSGNSQLGGSEQCDGGAR